MNSEQAKNLNFPDLLSRLGYEPVEVKKGGNDLWYLSPLRKEKEASFCVSKGRKVAYVWKDFGDAGGTVIDFIMRFKGYHSVKEALAFLESMYPNHSGQTNRIAIQPQNQPSLFSFSQQGFGAKPQRNFSNDKELEFLSAGAISNPQIFAYLWEVRRIPDSLASLYLQEVKYLHKKSGKTFFAFGMENQSGGYEIRAATDNYSFKSALNARDVSIIEGADKESRVVNLFEGMIDFLSLLVMLNVQQLSGHSIVMHSLSSFSRTVKVIRAKDYQTINTFLDNDRVGEEHTEKFVAEFGERVVPQSDLFSSYKDLNKALQANQIPDFLTKKK